MAERKRMLLQGNEAVVEGAIAAGMRFFAGYPITPSTEIAEGCARRLPQVGGRFIQMEDEISSMAAVIGASTTGTKSMTATSGPGFSLKQENIGYAALAEIPCVWSMYRDRVLPRDFPHRRPRETTCRQDGEHMETILS